MTIKTFDLAVLFTGHMVDLPGRPTPRFPQQAEPIAWRAIREALERARTRTRGSLVGIASGARGGDLLFHEACRVYGIERRMVLPFPPEDFIEASVAGVPNGRWETLFWDNWNALSPTEREIVQARKDDKAYALCNERMVELAREIAGSYEIIALWDGKEGDGPGGTAQHVAAVKDMGGKVDMIDATILVDPARSL